MAAAQIEREPTERAVGERDVPFVPRPPVDVPPIPRESPRARGGDARDRALRSIARRRGSAPRRRCRAAAAAVAARSAAVALGGTQAVAARAGRVAPPVLRRRACGSLSAQSARHSPPASSATPPPPPRPRSARRIRRIEAREGDGVGAVRVDEPRRSDGGGADERGETREHGGELADRGRVGCQRPPCPATARTGCAVTATLVTAAVGGCASRSRRASASIARASPSGYASGDAPLVVLARDRGADRRRGRRRRDARRRGARTVARAPASARRRARRASRSPSRGPGPPDRTGGGV